MIQVSDVGLRYGDRKLFEDVNIKFTSRQLLRPNWCKRCGKINILKNFIW